MFADIANVLRIREALWRHRALGSASVMVGAGFSRNAEPVTASVRSMPSWAQMAQALCEPLYPDDDARRNAALREANSTSGFLRIAEEYHSAFGASDLNDRIRNLVPDTDYRPGDLHRRLLRLPWADVFSTNWDTLLERACADVMERSYDVVRTMGEIPFTTRPRIVKLHGSFPGHEPFIFTEEDYRTYPRRFSPLVNLVQQSMMETIFCLVGFSGDDPNFLHWSGWVRDNLGPSAPRIYLVGWLELSVHRRRMLEARSVMPIDLSTLPQAASWPSHLQHRYAIEWFLAALELGKSHPASSWPSPPAEAPPPPVHLRPLPSSGRPAPLPEPGPRDSMQPAAERLEALRTLVDTWRRNRQLYPGWFIPPEAVRQRLWRSITTWSRDFNDLSGLEPWEQIVALGELAWRTESSLFSFFSDHEASARTAIDAVDLHARTVGGLALPQGEPWSGVLEAVELLGRALARNGRHELDEAKFQFGVSALERLAENTASASNEATYQRCLWDLANGDLAALIERLDGWQPGEGDNIWNLRKAGLLAEVDDNGRACALLESTLQRIRRNRRRDVDDFQALSLEGWALFLALAYADRGWLKQTSFATEQPEPFQRWRELAVLDCDAFTDWTGLRRAVESGKPAPPQVERVRGFDLNHASITRQLRVQTPENVLGAYRVVMLAELTGIPPGAQNIELLGGGLKWAATLLASQEPALAAQIAMRLRGTGDILDTVFTRANVARLPLPLVLSLRGALMRRLSFALARVSTPGRDRMDATQMAAAAFELLSRIAVRLPTTDLRSLLDDTLQHFGRVEIRRRTLWLGRALGHLLQRVLESLPREEITSALSSLFALPLPSEADGEPEPGQLKDPVFLLPEGFDPAPALEGARGPEWSRIVERLLEAAHLTNEHDRRAAVYRLFLLHEWHALSPQETSAFARAVWGRANLDPYGLPRHTGLMPWVVLRMPEEQPSQAQDALLRYILEYSGDNGASVYARARLVGHTLLAARREGQPLSLSPDHLSVLKTLVLQWTEHTAVPPNPLHLFDTSDQHEGAAIDGIAEILRYLTLEPEELTLLWRKADAMDEGRDGSHHAGRLYRALAVASPERGGELVQRLRRALVSDDPDVAQDAVLATSRWLSDRRGDQGLQELEDLVREIGLAIAGRRATILPPALGFGTWLFNSGPAALRTLIVDECEHGLVNLLEEARYDRTGQPFDVPEVRAKAFALARAMFRAGWRSLPGVGGWIEAAATDPLPEVRLGERGVEVQAEN